MLRGYLDAITSSGHIEGWAYDTEAPFAGLHVSVLADDGRCLGQGIAGGFREDLMAAGIAGGWCAFRIRLSSSTTGVRAFDLMRLAGKSGAELIARQSVPYVVREEEPIQTVSELIDADPTRITSLHQLSGCDFLFKQFVKANGSEAFVRTAYMYLLARSADPPGLLAYKRYMESKGVTPYGVLLAISDSEEYRSKERRHLAPTASAFPFLVAPC